MQDEYRELARRLFATAAAILEDAIEHAVAGQSPKLSTAKAANCGHQLEAAASDVATIAAAVMVVARLDARERRPAPRKRVR